MYELTEYQYIPAGSSETRLQLKRFRTFKRKNNKTYNFSLPPSTIRCPAGCCTKQPDRIWMYKNNENGKAYAVEISHEDTKMHLWGEYTDNFDKNCLQFFAYIISSSVDNVMVDCLYQEDNKIEDALIDHMQDSNRWVLTLNSSIKNMDNLSCFMTIPFKNMLTRYVTILMMDEFAPDLCSVDTREEKDKLELEIRSIRRAF